MSLLTHDMIDPEAKLRAFRNAIGDAGAVVSFTGQVRSEHGQEGDENPVKELFLQAHPVLTEKGIISAIAQVETRWALTNLLVRHRIGSIAPSEVIVLVATASKHRREAFEAADFLMDYLKTEAVFWKRECRAASSAWIEPREADYEDALRWREEGEICPA